MSMSAQCYNTIVFFLISEIPKEEGGASMTEEEAKTTPNALIGEFPLASSGMAQILSETGGSVRLFVDRDSHQILGGHISGSHAEELTRVISLAIESNAKLEDLINLVYCHPTLSEAIGEAAESILGHSIHLIPRDVKKPEELEEYDVAVIGAGPAGYAAAIRAAQLGQKVAIIERDRFGGTCLIRGCIPTKVILEALKSEEEIPLTSGPHVLLPEIKERMEKVVKTLENGVQRLLTSNGVMIIEGEVDLSKSKLQGSLLELVVGAKTVKSRNVILATGSKSASLPGLEINHRNIIDSTDALELDIPDEITIVGAGAIGLEFATIYKALGCIKVTVVEQAEQVCPQWLDRDVAEILKKEMEKHGIAFELRKRFDVTNIPGGKVLIAVGRTPNTRHLSEKEIALAANGFVKANERYQVKLGSGEYAENVFAVGDVVGGPLLAHKGSEEGKIAASVIAGGKTNFLDYDQVPSVIFSNPEQASAGLTEEAAKRSGKTIEIKYLQTPDKGNIFKIITEKDSLKVLGVSVIGHSAPYVIAEMTLAVRMGVTLEQLMKEGLTLASAREIDLSELEKAILSTPLTEVHREAGADVNDYHGWWLPMRYTDSQEEVVALRNKAAIWDIGHMAVLEVTGEDAEEFLQYLTTNDVSRLKVGQLQYSFFLDEKARPLDDVIVYKLWGRRYFVVVNSTNREKIKQWMNDKKGLKTQDPRLKGQKDVHIVDLYDCPEKRKRVTLFSIQGPESENILSELTSFDLDTIEYFRCRKIDLAGKRMLVQRGGYSGEEGFEIFVPVHHAADLWRKILSVGEKYGLRPAGLVARDMARQEACLPLYGNEWPQIDPYDKQAGRMFYNGQSEFPLYITPYEANAGWAVKTNKGDFIGKDAYVKHLNDIKQGRTESYTRAGIELPGKWNLYKSSRIFVEDQEAGIATSGRFSQYLGKSICLAYVKENLAELGVEVAVEIGQDRIAGKIVPTPFVNNITYPHRGDAKENARYYITLSDNQIGKMLHDIIDADSIDELCQDLRATDQPLPKFGLPQGLSRRKNYYHHSHLARINYSLREYSSFLGAGSYDYEIPDVVNWAASLRGLYTPYTPYQAEVAQGLLRFFYIYQSQICQLTGMEVANASLYDGATALAEAAFMSVRITDTPDEPRSVFLVANPLHPFYYQVLETYSRDVGCKVLKAPFDEKRGTVDLEALRGMIDRSVACVIVQQPNFFGQIEGELQEVAEHTHDSGALLISCTTDPHALGILEAPGYYGADIAVGEIQAFGNPVNGGGPNSGFLATSEQYLREVPGRIVGRTKTDGKETFCLIRQTREQHVSRSKAKSNICSNTAFCATRAALYMLAQGREGLHEVNRDTLALKEFFLSQLQAIPGFELAFEGDSFNEVTVRVPVEPDMINRRSLERKCLGALDLTNDFPLVKQSPSSPFVKGVRGISESKRYMLFSFTNRVRESDVDRLTDILLDVVDASGDVREEVSRRRRSFAGEIRYSPEGIQRDMPLDLPQYSEADIFRFARDMADLNIDIDAPLYPLGSCTMKYNPRLNEKIAALEGFSRVHPLAPDSAKQGTLKLAYGFSQYLCQITGMDAVTLQPEAGAHGEFTGLKVIRAAHIHKSKAHGIARDLIITSDSSHGTNPASAAMAGMEILEIPSVHGMINVEAFRKAVEENKDRFAGTMLTIPNTLGIFEPAIPTICQITHDYGGYVYMDGANFNALIGQVKVRSLGVDVMHFNLHKTFATPHGGGGPGAGPIAVVSKLEPYLPIPRVRYDEERDHYSLFPIPFSPFPSSSYPNSIGKVSSFFGPYGVVVKANAYRMALGEEGMRRVSETAILNANYMLKRIMNEAVDEEGEPLFKVIYEPGQYCMHEFVISSERFEKNGLSAIDFAKGIIDYGVYAPTVGFPLFFDHGRHAIMVEPTETATREGMDYFCDKFIELAKKAWKEPNILKDAPSKLPFRRISVADADRELDVRASVRELIPYAPISGAQVTSSRGMGDFPHQEKTISLAKRRIITQIEGVDIPGIPEEIDPASVKFLEEGEWVFDLGDGFALCGLSKETVEMIEKLKFSTVHLPKLGTKIEQGQDTGASVDFDKVASPIYAPVGGRVVMVNPALAGEESFHILIAEPYKRGWLFVVQMDDAQELSRTILKGYEEYLKGIEGSGHTD